MTSTKSHLFLLVVALFTACDPKNPDSAIVDSITADATASLPVEEDFDYWFEIENYIVKESNVPSDSVQVVDATGVIVIYPTEHQMAMMMKDNEEDFYTIADDATFYHANAVAQFDSLAVKTIEVDKRYLKLVGKDKTWLIDIRQADAPEWNMIFFDQHKAPKVVPAIDVTPEELLDYFGAGQ